MVESKRTTVLIADDDEHLQRAYRRVAEAAGYVVLQVFDGTDVHQLARSERPDVIVLDVTMPDSDGRDVLAELKQDPATAGIPVLICSARSDQLDRHVGLRLGAEDYLDKPCSPEVLIRKLGHVLERARGEF